MVARLRSLRQKIKRHPARLAVIVGAGVPAIALIVALLGGYLFSWDWTGFNGGESKITITSTSKGTTTAQELQPARTLWDWLELLAALAIPIVVGFGVAWFTSQQGKVSNAENKDNQREDALQAYIDKISELLLHEKLRGSADDDEVRKIARVRTLTVLRGLDAQRKASLLQFLHESGLIDKNNRIIDLSEAQLSEADLCSANLRDADLREANLRGANLGGVNLLYANLRGADLQGARLPGANLRGADLREVNLQGADLSDARLPGVKLFGARLSKANLSRATLEGAVLEGADLSGANLLGASVTTEQLEKANSLQGATMPDGSKHA